MVARDIFADLFVLEMTNNHLGRLDRGLEIVRQHARAVHAHGIRAAIKLQFRDVDSFIHPDYRERTDIRYIRRVAETRMSKADYAVLVDAIRDAGCIPMATPFDEQSVDWCLDFDMPIIKVASADAADWPLLEAVAATSRPVIVSVGGTAEKDIDKLVAYFELRGIPLALNHCIAAYPHDAAECQLNQIDYLRRRYREHTIGYSSHEHADWTQSMLIAYAKGARTFERHIDIDTDGAEIATYSSLPSHMDTWYKAFRAAQEYCGTAESVRATPLPRETHFLDNYIRGAYAKRDLPVGHVLTDDDVQLAIPLRKGQISCREFRQGEVLLAPCAAGQPIKIDMIDSPYANDDDLKHAIYLRGLDDEMEPPVTVVYRRVARPRPVRAAAARTQRVQSAG